MKHIYLLSFTLALSIAGFVNAGEKEKQPEFKAPELRPLTEKLPSAFLKATPESIDDLKAIQDHVAKVTEKVLPAVVCVRVGPAFGSGVIVTKDGYVLTAGHVSGEAGRDVTIIFPNGKTAKGKTLGANRGIDSGMIKITTEGDWPIVDMGDSAALKKGEWCMVCAHPGGYKSGRSPVLRLGRQSNATTLTTDCILVGGDSGGPLFDMHGRVIGINSRIGQSITANMHVPVNPFRENWERQAKGEVWGQLGFGGKKGGPWLGVRVDADFVVKEVTPGSPAEKAGLKLGDILRKFDGKDLTDKMPLNQLLRQTKIGAQVVLEIERGGEALALKMEIGKRP
jgi:serine protease Do